MFHSIEYGYLNKFNMVDFDKFEKDIRATFDLLDDIKSGEGLNWDRVNRFFESPLFKRRNNGKRNNKFSSFPRFGSRQSATESSENDSGDEVFSSQTFRRSDSTYSTSSYDTTDSNETVSAKGTSSKFQKRDTKVQIPVQHYRTSSSSSSQGLSKKLEDQFLNEERHSMPHEIYSDCDPDKNANDKLFRPVSAPPKPDPLLIRNQFHHDTNSGFKCFPSRAMDSQEVATNPDVNANCTGSASTSPISESGAKSPQNRPEICRTTSRSNSRDRTLPDVLKKDGISVNGPPTFGLESNENSNWEERQSRVESALKWLRSELVC